MQTRAETKSGGDRTHSYVNSNPDGFDSNCRKCGGKQRDSVHNPNFWSDMAKDKNSNKSAACEARALGKQKYICVRDTDGRELTKEMTWTDAENWAASPLTKGAYPEGVVIVPASYPKEVA